MRITNSHDAQQLLNLLRDLFGDPREIKAQNHPGTDEAGAARIGGEDREQEAQSMVDSGQASALIPGDWRDRQDVPWEAIQLIVQCDPNWSPTSLGVEDCYRAAGWLDADEDWSEKCR